MTQHISALLGSVLLPVGKIIRRESYFYYLDIFPGGFTSCCYVIWDRLSDHPVYVGMTRRGAQNRILGHRYGSHGSGPSTLGRIIKLAEPYSWDWIVEVIEPSKLGWEDELERSLIRKLEPWLNRSLNGGSKSRDVERPWWLEI